MKDKNICSFPGRYEELVSFIEEFQLLRSDLWKRFVQQFKEDSDYDAGWRCEYWGKMMRGASFTYAYTKDPVLYDMMVETV